MNERLQRFTDLMKQIFELDKSDLDFGIYRIMNIRKTEIEKFLTEGLPEKVRDTLAPFAQGDQAEIRRQIAEIEKNARDFGMDAAALPEDNPMGKKYRELQKQLAEGTDLAALETDVYSALYSFFNRYYEEGDFISKRRYKEGVYAIPYEGEEVKLYWANQDQYYIKTSENFKDYTFLVGDYTVHFRLVDATTEQNNNKESADSKRVFMLFTEDEENYPGIKTFEYNDETKELIIRFIFDIPEDKKRKYFDENYEAIRKFVFENHLPMWQDLLAPVPTGKGNDTTDLLKKHLNGYVAKNTFDYFIHKDLRGFLNRELDFYIKSEIMHLDDLDTGSEARVETYLAKVKAVKRVGRIIIDFLAQIEDFQKKLWLKKKFVVETNWCMTLDKVDESFWPEIIANKAQIDEWIAMYAIDEAEDWTNPPSLDFLRQNQNLLIDTKHFNEDFKERLVASVDRLDEQTNGLMIRSDNFQALGMLKNRYEGMINYCYIDPPYNTDSAPILYKNGYRDSSWLSLMNDRVITSKVLLAEKSVYTVAIDDTEFSNVSQLLRQLFPNHRISPITVVHNPKGSPTKDFNRTHEYAIFITEESAKNCIARIMEENDTPRKMRRWGENSKRIERPLSFYPIYVKNGRIVDIGEVPSAEYHPSGKNEVMPDGRVAIWPIDQNGIERRWNFGLDTIRDNIDRITIITDEEGVMDLFLTHEMTVPKTVWKGGEYDAGNYGNTLLTNIIGNKLFDFPKSINTLLRCVRLSTENNKHALILDFFAGSGTTGHAVIEYNRANNDSKRKYILVEMGEYFDTVTKTRMEKVVYSADWKDGKPQNRNTGVSQIIKYLRLESYEDALSNIELKNDPNQMSMLFGEEYLVRYMLDLESKDSLLNVAAFKDPFSYKMKITEKNECKERPVDLIETFNYLIGLTVTHQAAVSYFSAKPAADPAYEGAVELRRDLGGQYAFRQIEGTLPDGRRALVIWRTVSDNVLESNAALDAYFTKYRINPADREYDVIYVNSDNNLENLRTSNETWKVQMTEIEFKKRMFEEA